jgi:hypothetical protein
MCGVGRLWWRHPGERATLDTDVGGVHDIRKDADNDRTDDQQFGVCHEVERAIVDDEPSYDSVGHISGRRSRPGHHGNEAVA